MKPSKRKLRTKDKIAGRNLSNDHDHNIACTDFRSAVECYYNYIFNTYIMLGISNVRITANSLTEEHNVQPSVQTSVDGKK